MLNIAFGIVIGLTIVALLSAPRVPNHLVAAKKWWNLTAYDVTDDIENGHRSGLTIYIDYGTGCQYVGTFLGGITPRLDAEGKPICVPTASPNSASENEI